mmetsp:Transcript_5886/g.7243  ORF Transcript_5886/g.7243 Transcript_5886/m.7243 type:complete len:98 (+) Transcript_5886:776-1069(+)
MAAHPDSNLETYVLKKDASGCTGMFFRPAPAGVEGNSEKLANNWPRDGALLAGDVVTASDGSKWLRCKFVQQKGGSWEDVSNGFMPFRYQQYFLEKV